MNDIFQDEAVYVDRALLINYYPSYCYQIDLTLREAYTSLGGSEVNGFSPKWGMSPMGHMHPTVSRSSSRRLDWRQKVF